MRRRLIRRRPRRDLPWDEDPRNPDMKVLRAWTEETGFGWIRRARLMTPEASSELAQQSLLCSENDPRFPSWDRDPTYF